MKNNYYILGSGGFAKEVYFLAEESLDDSFSFNGFIDVDISDVKIIVRGKEELVIDENYFLEKIKPEDHIYVFMGIGDPKLISKLSDRFKSYNFPNLIHKNFIGDRNSIEMGLGNIITAGVIFTVDIKLGSFNVFNLNTTIGHDVIIGDCNIFNPGSNISGSVNIGSRNLFGTNCTVLQLIKINDNNVIGASSLVNKNVESDSIMVGVPAKKLER